MEERHPIWRVAANILNKQCRTTDKGRSCRLGVVRGANDSSSLKKKTYHVSNLSQMPRGWRRIGPGAGFF